MEGCTETHCEWCGCELDDEERESPRLNENGRVLCDNCWSGEYEGICYRCRETVELSELDNSPGRLIVVLEEAEGLPANLTPGYYRVEEWPLYSDSMVEMHMESNNLVKVSELEDNVKKGDYETERTAMCGSMCKACQEIVEGLLKNKTNGKE